MASKVLDGTLKSDGFLLSSFLGQATALYLYTSAPYELELDLWLQLYTEHGVRRIRLTDDVVMLDTETVIFIPIEYQNLTENKRLAVYSSGFEYIEVWALYSDVPSIEIQTVLDAIQQVQESLTTTINGKEVDIFDVVLPLTNLVLGL